MKLSASHPRHLPAPRTKPPVHGATFGSSIKLATVHSAPSSQGVRWGGVFLAGLLSMVMGGGRPALANQHSSPTQPAAPEDVDPNCDSLPIPPGQWLRDLDRPDAFGSRDLSATCPYDLNLEPVDGEWILEEMGSFDVNTPLPPSYPSTDAEEGLRRPLELMRRLFSGDYNSQTDLVLLRQADLPDTSPSFQKRSVTYERIFAAADATENGGNGDGLAMSAELLGLAMRNAGDDKILTHGEKQTFLESLLNPGTVPQ